MQTQLLISITGPQTDGFFNELTVATKALGGKWLANKFAYLDGRMAALLKLEIDRSQVSQFEQVLANFTDMTVSYEAAQDIDSDSVQSVQFTLEGEDRSGLTSDITHLLDTSHVQVKQFESRRYPITELGTEVFEANLELLLPPSVSVASLQSQLEQLSDRMRVFVSR